MLKRTKHGKCSKTQVKKKHFGPRESIKNILARESIKNTFWPAGAKAMRFYGIVYNITHSLYNITVSLSHSPSYIIHHSLTITHHNITRHTVESHSLRSGNV
jgi:hypothetical protein